MGSKKAINFFNMIKIQPYVHHGFEYIRISELPLIQHFSFKKWVSPSRIFELETEEKMASDCVAYGEYEFWFETQCHQTLHKENLLF